MKCIKIKSNRGGQHQASTSRCIHMNTHTVTMTIIIYILPHLFALALAKDLVLKSS